VAARAGASYQALVRLRNDGSESWRPDDGAALGFRWRRVSSYLKGFAAEGDEVVVEGPRVPLPDTVAPGRAVNVRANVPLVDAGGRPLPVWTPDQPWSYVLEWDLWDGRQWATTAGAAPLREVVEAVDRDPAPAFIGCNLGRELVAGQTEKVTVALRNLGPESWKADRDRIVVHWYYQDGSEAAWCDSGTRLAEDVPPFSRVAVGSPAGRTVARRTRRTTAALAPLSEEETTIVRDVVVRDVPVRVPRYFGPLYCVFDLECDGRPASTAPANKGADLLVVPVNVYSPDLLPLPLAPFFNMDGISSDLNRGDGDLDGSGASLPAEQLPPYVSRPASGGGASASPIYACGLWLRALNGKDGDRMTFMYPSKADRAMNMVACDGQQLSLAGGPRRAVHLLALATGDQDPAAEFRLVYSDRTEERREVTVTRYTEAPRHGEHAAFVLPHRHTGRGDDLATRCYLNHYVIQTNPLKPLAQLQLPKNRAVKILAITLEAGSG
jgi:hypothetical protein